MVCIAALGRIPSPGSYLDHTSLSIGTVPMTYSTGCVIANDGYKMPYEEARREQGIPPLRIPRTQTCPSSLAPFPPTDHWHIPALLISLGWSFLPLCPHPMTWTSSGWPTLVYHRSLHQVQYGIQYLFVTRTLVRQAPTRMRITVRP